MLLADDYAGILTALERLLKFDCEIVGCVGDGFALLDAAKRLNPDVIVVDLNMPALSGLEACRRIKQTASDIEVIVLTATDDKWIEQVAIGLGAFALIDKSKVADCLMPAILQAWSRGTAARVTRPCAGPGRPGRACPLRRPLQELRRRIDRASTKTRRSIGRVSLPVKVFCCDGW